MKKNWFIVLPFFILLTSCLSSRPVPYFSKSAIDTSLIQIAEGIPQVIQKGDILSIQIYSDNPEATAIFNQAGGSFSPSSSSFPGMRGNLNMSSISSSSSNGYLVDIDGKIFIHGIGVILAEGKTKNQLKKEIEENLNKLGVLKNPYVGIRFSNFKVTVLGEVRNPGVFTLPSEKANLLEAIGLAGELTDFGLKDRVLVIRENNGKRSFHRVNLLDAKQLLSPYFSLKQNDIIIVDPNLKKPTALEQKNIQYISVAAALISTSAILVSLFK
jgi:polysaccharide export outer membrane protein